MTVKHVRKLIPITKLELDDENPRFFHLRFLHGRNSLTQNEILAEIGKDHEIKFLKRTIQKNGVQEPIWVKQLGTGKYRVIEGNRRTCVLHNLCAEGLDPPEGIRYDVVEANVVDENTQDVDLLILKISLQTGKKTWRAFNEAAATYELSKSHGLTNRDIANVSMISVREVKHRITNFKLFQEYVQASGSLDIGRFAFFSDMPPTVRKWIMENEENKQQYFNLITTDPETGIRRLPSVATKGGVRDFSKLLSDKRVALAFIRDKTMTMETALKLLKGLDIWKQYKWLRIAENLSDEMIILGDEDIKKIRSKKTAVKVIKQLSLALLVLVERLNTSKD
jgi:hypothetical protein